MPKLKRYYIKKEYLYEYPNSTYEYQIMDRANDLWVAKCFSMEDAELVAGALNIVHRNKRRKREEKE